MSHQNRINQGSLPGVRQGISGAGAGDDSMRTTGGRVLNRRVPPAQEATADSAEASASSVTLGTTSRQTRRRMKWSIELNKFIMLTYYTVTNLETQKVGYRQELHRLFRVRFPEIEVSEQRIADQRHVIVTNNLLPPEILQELREEAGRRLGGGILTEDGGGETTDTITTGDPALGAVTEQRTSEPAPNPADQGAEELLRRLEVEFRASYDMVGAIDPSLRPTLPRLSWSPFLVKCVTLMNRSVLPDQEIATQDMLGLQTVIYVAATATVIVITGKNPLTTESAARKSVEPIWKKRLESKVNALREDLGRLIRCQRGEAGGRTVTKVNAIMRRERFHPGTPVTRNRRLAEVIDTLKQRLAVAANRLRQYNKSARRRVDNLKFDRNEAAFYRQLEANNCPNSGEVPTRDAIQEYWGNLWSAAGDYNRNAAWLRMLEVERRPGQEMVFEGFTEEEIGNALRKCANWKAPGPDGIHNFWWKRFSAVYGRLAEVFSLTIADPWRLPAFMTLGVTYLKHKGGDARDPAQYRPITCLSTLYKLLTTCIAKRVHDYVDGENIIADVQKGCARGSYGCKELLIIDTVATEQAKRQKRNLYMAYIDYRKAYDSVPHTWLTDILKLYGVATNVIRFLNVAMGSWRTHIVMPASEEVTRTEMIQIKRGIFQGDALSPLWFVLAINPLSALLESSGYGYAWGSAAPGQAVTPLLHGRPQNICCP
ncbi:uncharacterized protein [Rhodnius prolixus]|uniref:uncharacterized protein n=1 Tax=Rhodnius prolixus TaxID=13249 RepID=UPI003D187E36